MIDGVLLDIDGVLYQGSRPLAGARDALKRLHDSGVPVSFVTNTSRSSRAQVAAKLQRLGFPVPPERIFTAPIATADAARERGLTPYLLVHPRILPDLEGLGGTRPDAVLIGDAGEHFTHRTLNAAFRLLIEGAPLLAIARNRYFRDDNGLSLDMGAYVAALEYAAGVEAELFGKPAAGFFHAAVKRLGVEPERVLMVGDDVESDVIGALDAGLQAALVRTGKFTAADEERLAGRAPVFDALPSVVDRLIGS